ncbi:MAG: PilN domain-containing protein [Deltaproteobacteria bacterium]|nr:PilN domain-containing protein [Deltaproteobacteria bacterium]
MITINLLPIATFQQQHKGRTFLMGYGIFVVIAAAVLFLVKSSVLDVALENLAAESGRVTNSLNDAKKKVTEATAVTNATITRWKQLAAIMELEERRRDQTRLLVEVEELLPKTNAWLVGLTHQGGVMSLEGISTDKETVSQFLTSLENAAYIDRASVTLVQISQDLVINGVKLTKFSINARTSFPMPEILNTGLPDYGLPSREEFVKAVKTVDEKLGADLEPESSQPAGRRGL